MAAVCQLMNKDTQETVWRYSVDAKEILAASESPWRLTGKVKTSGWATPAGPRTRISASVAANQSTAAAVATGVVAGLVEAGVLTPKDTPTDAKPPLEVDVPVPEGFEDGLPPEEGTDPLS